MAGLDPAIHAFLYSSKNVDARDKPGHDDTIGSCSPVEQRAYALAMSGKTASILVFSVAALNGLTM
jgi:hypothetical protein